MWCFISLVVGTANLPFTPSSRQRRFYLYLWLLVLQTYLLHRHHDNVAFIFISGCWCCKHTFYTVITTTSLISFISGCWCCKHTFYIVIMTTPLLSFISGCWCCKHTFYTVITTTSLLSLSLVVGAANLPFTPSS